MNILGIHIGHDSGAALVRDGRIAADVAEERFVRIKHYCGLPLHSIDYCLRSQGLRMDEIDAIAIPRRGSQAELNFLLGLDAGREERLGWKRRLFNGLTALVGSPSAKPPMYIRNYPIAASTDIVHVQHHLAHAASAYYTCGSAQRQLIVTLDGVGDGQSIGIWRGENGRIERLESFPSSASLGWFYSNVTEALGWWHGDGEGKTMGLAPYGDFTKCQGALDPFHPRFSDGRVVRHHDFGRNYFWNEQGAIQWHFDEAEKIGALIRSHGREHIAAEAQRVLEEETQQIVQPWLRRENTRNLCAAGGVMLNVKLNQRLWESGAIDQHHTYPNPGDSGLAVGAALYVYYARNPGAPIHALQDLYTGPEYTSEEIEEALTLRRLQYRRIENAEEFVAAKLAENMIVGWFQGRMESGPRALGNRSILMSANHSHHKDVINARVKFREPFRPFCPSLLWERKEDYLERPRDESFMITSFTCKPGKRNAVPAVVHVDQTLRPQTVKEQVNPRYWRVIRKFGELTGEPLLLNTSFNVMGEPIVNHPREAIRCFYDGGLDVLAIGDFILEK